MQTDKKTIAEICKHLSIEEVNQWIWFSSIFSGILFVVVIFIGTVPFQHGFVLSKFDWIAVLFTSAFFTLMALRMANLCRCHWLAKKELKARRARMQIFIGWRRKDPAKIPVIVGGKAG